MSLSQGKSPDKEIKEAGGRSEGIPQNLEEQRDSTPAPGAAVSQGLRELNEGKSACSESDVSWRAIFDAMRDGIIVADEETRTFVRANSAMCRMLGYTERKLLALTPADIHPADLSSVIDAMYAALMAGEIETISIPTRRKDGTTFLSDITASHAGIQGRKCLIAVFRDVTDHGNAEAALREREARLRRAESMGLLGHYSFDKDGHNFVCSDGLKEIWGFGPDSHPSFADWIARIHPEDAGWVTADLRKCFQERRGFTFKHRIVHPDGVQVTVHSRGEVTQGKPGAPPRWLGTTMDITERKGIENVLRESEERLRLVIHATHDGIWDWNILTREAYFSAHWKEIVGYTGEELPNVDSGFFDLLHPDDKATVQEALHRHFAARAPFAMEFRLRHKDGTWRWVLSRGEAIFDSGGRPVRMIGVITDVTERKRAEQELRNSQARLQLIFDSTTDHQGLFRVKPGGRFILETANRAWKEFVTRVGLNAASFVGQEMAEFLKSIELTADQIENRRSMYQKAAREKTAVHFTSSSPGLRQEAVELLLTPVLDQNGECTHVLWNARVVTERVKAEAELREREKKLRVIFNAHRDLQSVIRIEPDGRFVTEDLNRAHLDYARRFIPDPLRYLERERVELLRAAGIPEDEIEGAAARWREVAAKKVPASYDLSFTIGPDRRRETAIVTIAPILSRDGACTHLLWTGHLITARKEAEQALAAERDRLRQILDSLFGFVAVLTPDGVVEEINRAPLQLTGLQRDGVRGRRFWEVGWLKPGTEWESEDAIRRAARGEDVRISVTTFFPGQGERFVEGSFSPLRGAEGKVVNVIAFGVDVTDRKRAEELLRVNQARPRNP
jgi:PAS domain S-box-containing protein